MSDHEERGGDDELDDLGMEEAIEGSIRDGVARLTKEFTPEQIAEWFLRSINYHELPGIADGSPLDPETGKPLRQHSAEDTIDL